MAEIEQVNERSTAYLTVTFRDKAGAEQAPVSATYRIDDAGSGAAVRAETPITAPGSTVEITLTPEDNRLLDGANPYERRRVTVAATYGAADAVNAEYGYRVIGIPGVAG